MKIQLPFLFLFIFCIFNTTYAQKEVCKSIYVWDFTDENGKKNNHTTLITQEVENALTETSCRVLQRRNYAKLSEQINNEDAIQTIEGMPKTISQELQSIKAETVLFGEVKMDFSSNIMLSVSFQNLLTKEILKSEFIFLAGEDAHNIQKRQKKIKEFISHCVGTKVVTNEETTYWEKVQRLNTVEAYQDYLSKYTNGKYRSQAEENLEDEQVWREIQKDKKEGRKIKNLTKYTQNQQHRHYAEAREQLEDILWRKGRYAEYKANFPEGKHADQVDKVHEESLYNKVVKNPSLFASHYIGTFPEGKYVAKVEDALWGEVISSKINHFDIVEYLKLFPNGKHAKEAKAMLEKE